MIEDLAATGLANDQVVTMLEFTHPNNPQAYARKWGVWLHGPVGVGKTETALAAITKPPFFVFDPKSNFPMHGYNGQADVIVTNVTYDDYERHSYLLKNLASVTGCKFDQKHSVSQLVRLTKGRL